MKTYTAALAIFVVVLCWDNASANEKIVHPMSVSVRESDGEVIGAKQCGGPAEFKHFRIQGCDASGPCKPKSSEVLVAEIDFIPVIDLHGLQVVVSSSIDGGPLEKKWDYLVNGNLKKGVKHTVTITAGAVPEAKGKKIHSKIEINHAEDKSLRVCMDADYEYV